MISLTPPLTAIRRAAARRRLVRAIYDHHAALRDYSLGELHLKWLAEAATQAEYRLTEARRIAN